MKQEPRPAYHRRQDLARLQALIEPVHPLKVADLGDQYEVATAWSTPLVRGRYQVVAEFLRGFAMAWAMREARKDEKQIETRDAEARARTDH